MKTIVRRLKKLEQRLPPPAAPVSSGLSAVERITEFLALGGVVRGEDESLADALARGLGISGTELRERLRRGSLFTE